MRASASAKQLTKRRIKVAIATALLLSLLAGVAALIQLKTPPTTEPGTQIVLKINDVEVLAKEYARELAIRLQSLDALAAKDAATVERTKKSLEHDLIVAALADRWAKENQVTVPPEEIEQRVAAIRKSYPDDLSFRRQLAEQNLSYADWRRKLESVILQEKVSSVVGQAAPDPSEKEIKEFYEKNRDQYQRGEMVKLRQIVLKSEDNADTILNEIKKGRSLSDLARLYSITPEASTGGDIGWISQGVLDIFDAAFAMRVGQISSIVKSPFGYHIFQVTDKKKASTLPLSDVKGQIRQRLMEERQQALFDEWLHDQLQRSRVFRNDQVLAAIQIETRN